MTCHRCAYTEEELDKAAKLLIDCLKPLGIDVTLEKIEISMEDFYKSPLNSNLIFINNKPLEQWLGAKTGSSKCCSVCGDNDCRTIEFASTVFETIPSMLIIKAGLLAAADMLTIDDMNTNKKIFIHIQR